MSIPGFDGDVDEFFDTVWPFFDGFVEETQCKEICNNLFLEFGKELKVCFIFLRKDPLTIANLHFTLETRFYTSLFERTRPF